ncbi:MAG: response regulator [Candidatus Anammoxibacter sp.]
MKKIVIVDDDVELRTTLIMVLGKAGYDVSGLEDGSVLNGFLQNQPVDLIITDLFMPDKDGFEIIMDCRKNFKDIKIVAMTGGHDRITTDFLKPAKFMGANHTIKKPFDCEEIVDIVKSLIGS